MKSKLPVISGHIAELEHERLISLINSMADAVIAINEDQSIVIYNGAALNILDINTELKDKNLKDIMRLVDQNDDRVNVAKMIKDIKTQYSTRDLRLVFPNGEKINLYLSIAPVHLGYGVDGHRGYVLLIRDITREKSLEEERDEFISVVSHELRTPIAIAEGNISNARFVVEKSEKDVPPSVKDSLSAAHEQIVFLSGMVNDLATLSRAERGKLNVEAEAMNVVDLINELVRDYQDSAAAKKIKLSAKTDPNLEILNSSKLYVREILQNFITNAIKYTEQGSIILSAKPKNKGVLFEVSDTGIGISKADKQKVFDKFFRSEDFRTRQNSGTGLGLYVTVKLAAILGAKIDLQSELNKGSTFSIEIPSLK